MINSQIAGLNPFLVNSPSLFAPGTVAPGGPNTQGAAPPATPQQVDPAQSPAQPLAKALPIQLNDPKAANGGENSKGGMSGIMSMLGGGQSGGSDALMQLLQSLIG
jgi:hypothetical protein